MLNKLTVDKGTIKLDGVELEGVLDFKIEKRADSRWSALSLKMYVNSILDRADERENQHQQKQQCSLAHRKRSYR